MSDHPDQPALFDIDDDGTVLLNPDAVAQAPSFRAELTALLNRHSAEKGSNTPDFVLAEYLVDCIVAYDKAVNARAQWYGRLDYPGQPS